MKGYMLTEYEAAAASGDPGLVGTPPGVCHKFKNEPEKLFRINKSAKKRT
jgi:hypothetical protein